VLNDELTDRSTEISDLYFDKVAAGWPLILQYNYSL
jgi:hypothetical protein